MKQPASVQVGPYDIPIKPLDPSDAEKNYGLFHSEKMEIRLRSAFASPQQAADTLLHEVLHAVWHLAGCSTKDGEERLVATLATQLCAVIKANPDLINYLQSTLKKEGSRAK
jgi:hypothetical protein